MPAYELKVKAAARPILERLGFKSQYAEKPAIPAAGKGQDMPETGPLPDLQSTFVELGHRHSKGGWCVLC
jgi:hypothetical protein